MMQVTIQPAPVSGAVTANPSKSAMQRAVAAALLAKGKTIIRNPGLSNDCLAALEVAENLGAMVKRVDEEIHITSNGVKPFTTRSTAANPAWASACSHPLPRWLKCLSPSTGMAAS